MTNYIKNKSNLLLLPILFNILNSFFLEFTHILKLHDNITTKKINPYLNSRE